MINVNWNLHLAKFLASILFSSLSTVNVQELKSWFIHLHWCQLDFTLACLLFLLLMSTTWCNFLIHRKLFHLQSLTCWRQYNSSIVTSTISSSTKDFILKPSIWDSKVLMLQNPWLSNTASTWVVSYLPFFLCFLNTSAFLFSSPPYETEGDTFACIISKGTS